MKFVQIFFLVICSYSYFVFSEVCVRIDGIINGYNKEHYFLKVDNKTIIQIKKEKLAKNLNRFLYMNRNNKVQECYPVNSIEKPFQKRRESRTK